MKGPLGVFKNLREIMFTGQDNFSNFSWEKE